MKVLGCLHTSFTDKIPKHFVPGCHKIVRHGDPSQSLQLMHKPENKEKVTIGNVSKGKKVKLYERREDTGALWQISLNCLLPEPLINIYVDKSPVIFLADTGSEVNCVSITLIEQIGYIDRVHPTKFRCCGPSGEPLRATGEVYLDFTLGNRVYFAKFIVLELLSKTAGI